MKKPVEEEVTSDLLEVCTADLGRIVSTSVTTQGKVAATLGHVTCAAMCHVTRFPSGQLAMSPQTFEKDDDSNGHIDFITAASVSEQITTRYFMNMAVVLIVKYVTCAQNRA